MTFAAGDLMLMKAPWNSKLEVTFYRPWESVRYFTRSHLFTEVLRSGGTTVELNVS